MSAADLPPPFLDLEEGLYNARDVLGMCRVYKSLAAAVERTNAINVYTVDKQMAFLANQMSRVGMPVDLKARDALGAKLRVVRDESAVALLKWTEGENFDKFVDYISLYQAAKARKDDPQAGKLDDELGTVHSAESAFLKRQAMRKAEFLAAMEKSHTLRALYDTFAAAPDGTVFTHAEMADRLGTDPKWMGNVFRSWSGRGIIAVEKRVLGRGKDKQTIYEGRLILRPEVDAADSDDEVDAVEGADDDDEAESAAEIIADAIGGINIGAKIQQAAILRVAGVPLTKITPKTGLPKVGKDTLEEVAFHEAARQMLDWILTAAAVRNVIEGYKIEADGRLHVEWMIHKITGRWGSSPNCQNISKRAGGGRVNMRSMFVAPEGFIFVGADFAQLEARIIAAASQDPFLLGVFAREEDIHGALAGVAFPSVWPKLAETYATHKGTPCGPNPSDPKSKCDFCKQRDKLRDLTKRLEYGAFYGGAAETLWKSVVKDFPDLKIQQIHEFLRTVGQKMAGVIKWRAETLAKAEKEFEIRSPILGRRELFPLGRVEPTVAYNYIPQSGGADLWALGAIDFMERWDQFDSDDARICHNGHDSILVLCREQYAAQVKRDVEECWTRAWNGVTFKIEADIGRRWSEV